MVKQGWITIARPRYNANAQMAGALSLMTKSRWAGRVDRPEQVRQMIREEMKRQYPDRKSQISR